LQVRLERSDDPSIKSGMYAQVLFPGEQTTAVTVPREALVERGQLNGLYTVTDGTVLLRWVRLGTDYGDRVEILSGLRDGETYVVNGGQRLLDGQPVENDNRTLGER
jgi:multidrug efflux pump subunit AcrA (membrane-fusion protein)